jgi:hypothetical protein
MIHRCTEKKCNNRLKADYMRCVENLATRTDFHKIGIIKGEFGANEDTFYISPAMIKTQPSGSVCKITLNSFVNPPVKVVTDDINLKLLNSNNVVVSDAVFTILTTTRAKFDNMIAEIITVGKTAPGAIGATY